MLIDIEELAQSYISYPIEYEHPRIWYRYYTFDCSGDSPLHLHSFKTLQKFYEYLLEWFEMTKDVYNECMQLIRTRVIPFDTPTTIIISKNFIDDGYVCKKWVSASENKIDKDLYRKYMKYNYQNEHTLNNLSKLSKIYLKTEPI